MSSTLLVGVLRAFRRLKRRRGQGDYAGSEDQIHREDIEAVLPAAERSSTPLQGCCPS